MSRHTAPALTCRRSLAVAALTCCLLLLLPGGISPAGAAEVGVTAPAADARIDGTFDVRVRVQPDEGEIIQQVEATLTGPTERVVDLVQDPDPAADGSQTWAGRIDPTAGGTPPEEALSNGPYRIAVRAVPLVGDPGEAAVVAVQLVVPPPPRVLTAIPGEADATAVELSWDPVSLPDFVAYRIERRPHDVDGPWTVVHDLPDERADRVVDAVGEPGAYRYRLLVVREDGAGGELAATSQPQGVRADPADPGTFLVPPEPAPRPSATPTPTTEPDGAAGVPPAPTAAPTAAPPPRINAPVTVGPPAPPAPPAPVAPPLSPPPAVVPFDDGVFEDLLPFEATESERIVVDTDTTFLDGAVREGGTLAVLTEEPQDRGVVTAGAVGLLLVVIGAHVRRFLAGGGRRRRP